MAPRRGIGVRHDTGRGRAGRPGPAGGGADPGDGGRGWGRAAAASGRAAGAGAGGRAGAGAGRAALRGSARHVLPVGAGCGWWSRTGNGTYRGWWTTMPRNGPPIAARAAGGGTRRWTRRGAGAPSRRGWPAWCAAGASTSPSLTRRTCSPRRWGCRRRPPLSGARPKGGGPWPRRRSRRRSPRCGRGRRRSPRCGRGRRRLRRTTGEPRWWWSRSMGCKRRSWTAGTR